MKKYFIILFLLSLLICWPFFKMGYFESHDGEWMVIRFSAFHQTLRSGQFPVRFLDRLNNNYGYPVANFLYPLPFYLAEIPKVLGFGFVDSIKIIFVLSTIASSILMFWALLPIFKKEAAFVGAIAYITLPYRLVDLYVRGSLGENLAFVFAAAALGFITRAKTGKKIYFILLSIALSLLFISHNVVAFLFLPILFAIGLILIKNRIFLTLSFLWSVLIAAFYILPAIYDLKYVRFAQTSISNISDHLVNFSNIIIPKWGYGPSPASPDGFSVQFGIIAILAALLTVYLRFVKKKKSTLTDFLLILEIIILFLLLKYSKNIWALLPSQTIQFPWRLLSIVVLATPIFLGFALNSIKIKPILIYLFAAFIILIALPYSKPRSFVNRGDGFYSTNEDTTTVRDEYLPPWVQEKLTVRASEKIELLGGGQISNTLIKAAYYKTHIETISNTKVQVNTIYFPGWQVRANNTNVPIDYQNPQGLIIFSLPPGSYNVIIKYGKTPVHLLAEVVSTLALLGTAYYFFTTWQKQNS